MRAGLLFADRELDLWALPEPPADLVADLELGRLFTAMAGDDPFLLDVARRVVPVGLHSAEQVRYRQAVLLDCLSAPGVIRDLYAVASRALEAERRVWGGQMRNPELVLRRSVEVLGGLLDTLEELRHVARTRGAAFRSPGFTGLFAQVAGTINDEFLAVAREQLRRLDGRTLTVTASLGPGNRSTGYVLRRPPDAGRRLRDRIGLDERRGLAVEVALHDQNAMNAMSELRGQAIADAASAVAEAVARIVAFLRRLRAELGFYVGCLNLHEALARTGIATCTPEPWDGDGEAGSPGLVARSLADPCLALVADHRVVGNDVGALAARLVIVTGANGGGKSTLLRAVGVAHVMMAAGMFVAAAAFRAGLRAGVLTHFPRDEESRLDGGRLDDELRRLDGLVERARPGSLVLLNESLSTTNERDGAEIARQLVMALADAGVAVWFVTHLHELARRIHDEAPSGVLFLRAERGSGGDRPYRLVEAPPLPTSFGVDLYRRIVGE